MIPGVKDLFQGVCVCLNNLDDVPKKCKAAHCQFGTLTEALKKKKRPTKTKFIKALIYCHHFTAEEVKLCAMLLYPRTVKQTLANSLWSVMKAILKEGYIVYKDYNGVYCTRKRVQ